MRLSTTIVKSARALSADSHMGDIVSLYRDAVGREAEASMARALVIEFGVRTFGNKKIANALYVGTSAISNVRKQVRVWEATGFSDAYVSKAWTIVTSSSQWLNKWEGTDEGKALMLAVQAAEGDVAKFAVLTGTALPEAPEAEMTADTLVKALQRALAIASKVTLTDEDRAIVDTLLVEIAGATASDEARVLVNA